MKIKYLYIRTATDEEFKIDDISYVAIGSVVGDCAWEKNENMTIDICCSKGRMSFKLSEIADLDFTLVNEKENYCIPIRSLQKSKWEEKERNGAL